MREYLILDKTEQRLLAHGLTLELHNDDDPINPRDDSSSVFVGGEVRHPGNIDKGECFEEYVKNYCKEILGCGIDDIIWATVYKYSHSGVSYSLKPFSCPWDSGVTGFIYRTKADIRKEYDIKRITKKVIKQVNQELEYDISDYNSFVSGSYYGISVSGNDGCLETSLWGIQDYKTYVDEVANEKIDEIMYGIKRADCIKVTFNLKDDKLTADRETMVKVTEAIQDTFDFMPTLGEVTKVEGTNLYSVDIVTESLISLCELGEWVSILDYMKNEITRLNHSGDYDYFDQRDIAKYIADRTEYNKLPKQLLVSAMHIILSCGDIIDKVNLA